MSTIFSRISITSS